MTSLFPSNKLTVLAIYAVTFLNLACGQNTDGKAPENARVETDEEGTEAGEPDASPEARPEARIIELTATMKVTNSTATDRKQVSYGINAPAPGLPYQSVSYSLKPTEVLTPHLNGIDRYIRFKMDLPANSETTYEIRYQILLSPTDLLTGANPQPDSEADLSPWLKPTPLVESDDPEITSAASLALAGKTTDLEKAQAAYQNPWSFMKYTSTPKGFGALYALREKKGDCTEFAALACALARAGGVPCRLTVAFNLSDKADGSTGGPNHDSTEMFVKDLGWIPADANLGLGSTTSAPGFAKMANNVIVLNRQGSWVYSGFSLPKGLSTKMKWQWREIASGTTEEMTAHLPKSDI